MLPADVNATIKADTLHGQIKTDLGVEVRKGRYVGQDLNARIGTGEAQIKLNSVNGALAISRRSDGRTPNQAIDLGGAAGATRVDTTKLDEEIARAVAEARKTASEAGKIRAEQLAKLKELEKLKVGVSVEDLSSLIAESVAAGVGSIEWISGRSLTSQGPSLRQRSGAHILTNTPKVVVEGGGCDVNVRSWDRSEVSYSLSETVPTAEESSVGFSEKRDGDRIELTVDDQNFFAEGGRSRSTRIRMDLYVPRNANLEISTDGSIRIAGVKGDMRLQGKEEQIDVRDAAGRLSVSLTEGRLRIIGFKGELEMDLGDSNSMIEGEFSAIQSKAKDASVMLTVHENVDARIISNTDINIDDIDGRKISDGEIILGRGGPTYDFRFAGGSLNLRRIAAIDSP
jgi:hypothetical protein